MAPQVLNWRCTIEGEQVGKARSQPDETWAVASIGLEVWIAVTVALSGALTSYLELKQAEATLVAYNQAATDLEGIRIWWHALPGAEKAKQENKEKLVEYTETVLKAELAGWVQEMMDALATLYAETETTGETSES